MASPPRERTRSNPGVTPTPAPRERTRSQAKTIVNVDRGRPDSSGIGMAWDRERQTETRTPVDLGPVSAVGYVRIGGGTTIPTAPFAGVRVEVAIEWPVAVNLSAPHEDHVALIETTAGRISQVVETIIQREIDTALGAPVPAVALDDDQPV